MRITVLYANPSTDEAALGKAIKHALRFDSHENPLDAEIHCNDRESNGWLEFLIVLRRPDLKHFMTIGMIQRQPGAEWEFHS